MGRLSGVSAAGVFEAPMITPELDAIMAMRVRQAAMDRDPELVPYIGPSEIVRRFRAGEIVTAADHREDTSTWVVEPIHHRAMARLQWMLRAIEHL
jgi:hypothetical protein